MLATGRTPAELKPPFQHSASASYSVPAKHPERSSRSSRKDISFGQWTLGQTLGEGEFGKVKLGWPKKRDGSNFDVQVAVKLIRKQQVTTERSKLTKIQREIDILRSVNHPNIVKLIDVLEAERHIGIVLEYASGGELFDFILKNRYLKDPVAGKLFAQLVSGVDYLHKKGVAHRDLKLENLLLDRNRNIIITDFGFATRFDPNDELDPNAADLARTGPRRADLMETSCGSPCYAAPELVISEGRYHGQKADVWSCGVILYAMLAGYLPFDDDPNNPDGDNIKLLYKYITTTPLTFPEFVYPMARDLLRRMLVPDPSKRITLDKVRAHPWMGPHKHMLHAADDSADSPRLKLQAMGMERSASEQPQLPLQRDRPQVRDSKAAMGPPVNPSQKRFSVQYESIPVRKTEASSILRANHASNMARSATLYNTTLANEPKPPHTAYEQPREARLPAPSSKPRPTSFHPSFAAPTFSSTIKSIGVDAVSPELARAVSRSNTNSSLSTDSEHPAWEQRRNSFLQRTGSTTKSTFANAPGEFSPSNNPEPSDHADKKGPSKADNPALVTVSKDLRVASASPSVRPTAHQTAVAPHKENLPIKGNRHSRAATNVSGDRSFGRLRSSNIQDDTVGAKRSSLSKSTKRATADPNMLASVQIPSADHDIRRKGPTTRSSTISGLSSFLFPRHGSKKDIDLEQNVPKSEAPHNSTRRMLAFLTGRRRSKAS